MHKAYSILGSYFEYLNDNCDYSRWSQYVHMQLKKYAISPLKKGLDIGCGNGYFTRYFTQFGMKMVAIDSSESMLKVAKKKALAVQDRSQYLLADITEYRHTSIVDFTIAINDCINYIHPKDLLKTFENISNAMQPQGIFIFDISTAYKLREELADETFYEEKGDIIYVWENKLYAKYIELYLTFFIKQKDDLYKKEIEIHRQYIYSKQEIIKALQLAGFKVLALEGHLGDKKDKLRTNFICQKIQ